MSESDFVELKHVSVFSMKDSTALFLVCEGKTLLIQTEPAFAEIAIRAMQGRPFPRPQTFELLYSLCCGFEVTLNSVFITDCRDEVYYARMVYTMRNELGEKTVELDARPSDALVQSFLTRARVFIARAVYDKAEDATPLLKRAQQRENKAKGGLGE